MTLEEQIEKFKLAGGEVTTYAAQPAPDKRAWRKKKTHSTIAFEQEMAELVETAKYEESKAK